MLNSSDLMRRRNDFDENLIGIVFIVIESI